MRSKKLIAGYSAILYWHKGFMHAAWYRSTDVFDTPEQRKTILEAEELARQALVKLESVFGPEIGKAIMDEERSK